jgi:hypothetical protein
MSDQFRISGGALLGVFLIAAIAIYVSFNPLGHTDVWAHAKYGEWYSTHRTAPEVEPLSPYSDKELAFGSVAWLSQVTYYGLYQLGAALAGGDAESQLRGGAEALRTFHLLLLVARFVLLWLALKRFGGSASWATLGIFLYLMAVGFGSAVQRPQAFGLFFFTAIIYALSSPTLTRPAMYCLPAMFLLWANLHGTFMAGLAMLGLHTVGRFLERRRLDAEVRRLAIVGVLCGLATLVNPHGPFLYKHLIAFSAHPNLKSMTEWYPMRFSLESGNHWPYLMSIVLLLFVRVLGGRKVGIAGWLVAIPFAIWPWLQARMIVWWWTIAVWLLARLGPGLGERFPTLPSIADEQPTRGKALAATAVIAFAVVMLPPLRSHIPGMPHGMDHTMHAGTPWRMSLELRAESVEQGRWTPALRKALRDYYPGGKFQGAIFSSETQGDFLLWSLPPEFPVLMYTHAHVFPVEHWEACRHVKAANPGWREFLARHRANLVVFEVDSHAELAAAVRDDPEWLVVQDMPQGWAGMKAHVLIALRKNPL